MFLNYVNQKSEAVAQDDRNEEFDEKWTRFVGSFDAVDSERDEKKEAHETATAGSDNTYHGGDMEHVFIHQNDDNSIHGQGDKEADEQDNLVDDLDGAVDPFEEFDILEDQFLIFIPELMRRFPRVSHIIHMNLCDVVIQPRHRSPGGRDPV